MRGNLVQNQLDARLLVIDRAKGVWLIDTLGKEYLDGCSGAVVTSIGHGNPDVLAAINGLRWRARCSKPEKSTWTALPHERH